MKRRGDAANSGARRGGGGARPVRQAVIVNLCMNSEETRGLGVENHVCELQLVLRDVASPKVSALGSYRGDLQN